MFFVGLIFDIARNLDVCNIGRGCRIARTAVNNQAVALLGYGAPHYLAPLYQKPLPRQEQWSTAGGSLRNHLLQNAGNFAGKDPSLCAQQSTLTGTEKDKFLENTFGKNPGTSCKCPRWIGNIFNRKLGGIDGTHSSSQKGLNGSIGPGFMFNVFDALVTASEKCDRHDENGKERPPVLIDIGASEGRVLMHWASYVHTIFNLNQIEVFGVEFPHYQANLQRIHEAVGKCVETRLNASVKLQMVWKDCNNIEALEAEFPILQRHSAVVYSFWTSWFPKDKEKLLSLVAAQKNITALAVYLKRVDGKSTTGESFDENFICRFLDRCSPDHAWTISFRKDGCKFIGKGNESATAFVFKRTKKSSITQCADLAVPGYDTICCLFCFRELILFVCLQTDVL